MSQKKQTNVGRPKSLPEQSRRLLSHFQPDDRVLVAIVADPDSMASAMAIKRLLWRKVASVTIAGVNEISRPDNQAMVRLLDIPLVPLSSVKPEDFSKLVIVDGQPSHHESLASLKYHVVIDHHPPGPGLGNVEYVDIRPRYGACSTILSEYVRGAKIKISARLATALLFGIKTDTASFKRPIIEEDVKAFQFLHPKANHYTLTKIELSEIHQRDLTHLKKALERMTVRNKTAIAHVGAVKNPDTLVLIADFFMRVENVEASMVSGVYQDKLVICARNATLRGNAGRMMSQAFGALGSAGGHKSMARAELPLANLAEYAGDPKKDEDLERFVLRRAQRPSAKLVRAPNQNKS